MLAEFLLGFVLQLISWLGYLGIFLLMFLESTVVPIPSELILPFAGFLVSQQKMGFLFAAITATLGSIFGSLFSYWLGKSIGREAILRYGKYFFLEEKHLLLAHNWFEKFGGKTVFICRFVPAIRHVISIPAGIAEMNLAKFVAFTALGAFCWNTFLIYSGIILEKNWLKISEYSQIIDIIIIIGAIIFVVLFLRKHFQSGKKSQKQPFSTKD